MTIRLPLTETTKRNGAPNGEPKCCIFVTLRCPDGVAWSAMKNTNSFPIVLTWCCERRGRAL